MAAERVVEGALSGQVANDVGVCRRGNWLAGGGAGGQGGVVIVTFRRHDEERVTSWTARRGKRTIVPGSSMALGRGNAPHDLLQFAVEGAVGLEFGFWGCVAKGATFRSLGRKRTRPGRAVIAEHRAEVDAAEGVAGYHVALWMRGEPTPAAEALTRLSAAWDALEDGEPLTVEWPSLKILPPEHAVSRK